MIGNFLRNVMILSYLGAVAGGAENLGPLTELSWRSTAKDGAELSRELERLYLSLYNTDNLALKTANVGEVAFLETTMRAEGAFFGSYFPVTIDAMLCDINPDVCSRSKQRAMMSDMASVTEHVGGYLPSPGQWSVRTGSTVRIPDYHFEAITTLDRIAVPANWTPESLLTNESLDCSRWGGDCLEVIRRFNPPLIKSPVESMTVTVPVLRLQTKIFFRAGSTSRYGDLLASSSQEQNWESETEATGTPASPFPNDSAHSDSWTRRLSIESPGDLILDSIERNLQPFGRAFEYSASAESHYVDQKSLFSLINHPYAIDSELPSLTNTPVTVAIIDEKVSNRHCDWLDAFVVDGGKETELPLGAAAAGDGTGTDCNAEASPSSMTFHDHPFAIGGLIAAQLNGHGMLGLNPNARLVFLEFEQDQPANVQIASLVEKLQTSIPETARVANLSFGVQVGLGNSDEVKTAFEIHNDTVLFVVAAGNEGADLSVNCPILPACLVDLDNVITVVGFNDSLDDPDLWDTDTQGSNHNPSFDIAAVATRVFATASADRVGWFSGTSVAAPQVAAAASLVIAAGEKVYDEQDFQDRRIQPKVVRDRLVYTADFFKKRQNDVFAGRLNILRAITVRDAQFVLKDGRHVIGKLQTFPRYYTCPTEADQGEAEGQSTWRLRRVMYDEVRGAWKLYRHKGDVAREGGRYSELELTDWCTIGAADPEVVVLPETGGPVSFAITDIVDYTSPLFN